jgi:signal transduction histidine kinase
MNTGILSNRITPDNRWFLVLAVLSVLPFLLSAGYSLVQLSHGKQDDVAQQLAVKANSTAQVVKERLATNVAALNALASSDAAVHDDLPALYLQAQRVMQRMPENSAIALTSPSGLILFTTLQPFGSPAFPSRTPEVWKRVFDGGQPVASEPFTNAINQRLVVAVGVPVFQQGKVAYCLSMVLLTHSISDLLMAQHLPDKWSTEIVSGTGRLLAQSRAADVELGKPASEEIILAKRTHRQDLFDKHIVNGTPEKAILVPIGNFDWSLAVSVPLVTLNEPVQQVTTLLLVFGAAFAFLGGLAVALPAYLLRKATADTGNGTPLKATKQRAHLAPSLIALAVSIVLGAYTAWLTQSNLQNIAASVDRHQLIFTERHHIEDLRFLFNDLETGQRAFVITGNEVTLEPFFTASKNIPESTRHLKLQFSANDPEEFNWMEFDFLADQYMQFARKVIATRREKGAAVLQDENLLSSGKVIMAKLALQFDEMIIRLANRTSRSDESIALQRDQAARMQWLSSFAVSALFLISVAIWLYERKRRIQVHAQLVASNSLLEERVAQRTHDLATANQRILLYAQEAQALVDSERKRLSREVHDQVGQIFTAIKMIAGSLKDGRLDTAQEVALLNAVDSGVRISRRIAAELRPPLLDDFGLMPALEHFLKSTCQPIGLSYDFQFPDDCRLASPQNSELFRMVQEACSNVLWHAKAMHMEVVGKMNGDYLDVYVDDDGVGFEPAQVREGALGILGMRERAHLIGAQIDIGVSPMGGTRVHIRVPTAQSEKRQSI